MRLDVLSLSTLLVLAAAPALAAPPACHWHSSKPVHFANAKTNDTLEMSIGEGPCHAATLTIVVHSESGAVLYSYVSPLSQHTSRQPSEFDLAFAKEFLERSLQNAVVPASTLPEWEEPSAYFDHNFQEIQIAKARYVALRKTNRPILWHSTYHEGGRSVMYDEKNLKAVIVTQGGA